MPLHLRPPATRVTRAAALTVALLSLSACAGSYPNSIFHRRSDFNRDAVGMLFDLILVLGVVVFVLVEALLLYTMWKYRSRPGQSEPEHVHGNTTMEIAWTVIPAIILAVIAVPTVRVIFKTEAPAPANALKVEVTGHQWWWEFRIPEYNVVTANELYLPKGRTVDFELKSVDVIHSFWIPAIAGKRDVIPNHTNHIWYTPDSTDEKAFNGVCVEYCGTSHANMRFRAFVVSPAEFESWAKFQATPATFMATPAPVTPPAAGTKTTTKTAQATKTVPAPTPAPVVTQTGYTFPADQMPAHVAPTTPLPAGLAIDENVLAQGDPSKAQNWMAIAGCVGCHTIAGNKMMTGITGPNLTHIGSRNTIGAGLFPNDAKHLALWIKNARLMKPGVIMPTLGKGQIDPQLGKPTIIGNLTDQQIADIVAYLRALK